MPAPSISKLVSVVSVAGLAALGGFLAYRVMRADLAADVYRQRLTDMAKDYGQLAEQYNEAVRRTAVTELVVRDNALSVRVVGIAGVEDEIRTPFDPRGEIYIDYVVVDGRLWIRRVFDGATPPSKGVVINPRFASVSWDGEAARHGKAVYRTLSDGRWVVTVSGDGSLGLSKVSSSAAVDLNPSPPVKDYSEATQKADDQARAISPAEVWNWLVGDAK